MIPYQPAREPREAGRYRHGPAPVVGLTGGIGGGKSAVAALLKERGAVVIDADLVGHEVLNDPWVRGRITERFGVAVLAKSGSEPGSPAVIDRRALGAIVFADPAARQDLESIVHPRMRTRFVEVIERDQRPSGGDDRLVVLDAAILLEAGWDDLCDLTVYVDAPRDLRLARVERQRGWTRATFEAREQAQWPGARKRGLADLVIKNDAGIDALRREVDRALAWLADRSCPRRLFEAPHP
jgi:dephospho-CoA kinase